MADITLLRRRLNLIRERRNKSRDFHAPFHARFGDYYNLYRKTRREPWVDGANDVHIPYAISIIQSDVARKAQILFGSWPVVAFDGPNSGVADKNSTLISLQMQEANSYLKSIDFFLSGDLYGTAIARDGWKLERREEQWRERAPDTFIGSGFVSTEQVKRGIVTRFDGPDWENLDLLDFLPQPGVPWHLCRWAMSRYYRDMQELDFDVKIGIYDADAVAFLKRQPGPAPGIEQSYKTRRSIFRNAIDEDARLSEPFAKPVELWDMVGWVPDEFGVDGVTFIIATMANDSVILRWRAFPFWHGELPFHVYAPMHDPHTMFGVGKIESVYKVLTMVNKFASQRADALDRVIHPSILVSRLAGIDDENLIVPPGRVIYSDTDVSDTMIRPLSLDMRGLDLAAQEIYGFLWKTTQQASGMIEDTVMGGQGATDRQTKAEFVGRQENVLTRQLLEAREAEESVLVPMANRWMKLNRQFLSTPKMLRMLGNKATVNIITGLPLPKEPVTINLDDINGDYSARAIGATQMLSRSARRNDIVGLLQVVQANPVAMQAINWVNFLKMTFETFDFQNVDELIVQSGAVPGINQVATDAGTSPESMASMMGNAMNGGAAELAAALGMGG